MGDTAISWCDKVWNCIRGCFPVSPGCANCYAQDSAISVNRRFAGNGLPLPYLGLVEMRSGRPHWTGEIRFVREHLADPLHWRAPAKIFVNSMSDLFYEDLHIDTIAAIYGVMAMAPRHIFQVLTKRAERMKSWHEEIIQRALSRNFSTTARYCAKLALEEIGDDKLRFSLAPWPLPNVWQGVSVENRKHGVPRIQVLRETPAAVRWLSIEPLLEDLGELDLRGIHWVVAGCESGPRARPCEVDWLRSIRDQCKAQGVAFFLKQAEGERTNSAPGTRHMVPLERVTDRSRGAVTVGLGSRRKKGGVIELPFLDGEQHAEMPVVDA